MTSASHGPTNWQERVFDKLIELRLQWIDANSPPDLAACLSSGEYVALALVAGHPHVLRDPVFEFLYLDGWLQTWVLRQRGLERYIGQEIGAD